jgi:hypothetical protein
MIIWIYLNKQWKDVNYKDVIPGKYEISNFGEITNKETGRLLKFQINKKGYSELYLRTKDGKRFVSVHRLVALHFIHNDDHINKTEVNHKRVEKINGKKVKSNYYENLEWVSHQENVHHSIDTGITFHLVGEESVVSIYTNEQIEFICKEIQKGLTTSKVYSQLILKFPELLQKHSKDNIKQRIRKIRNKRSWTHISDKYFKRD